MEPTPILIIILNWNGWKDTKECLDSVLKLTGVHYSVVVVDNGSKNDCPLIEQYGLENFSEFKSYNKEDILKASILSVPGSDSFIIIKNHENLGFAKANNIGIKYASLTNFEYIYLLNNDTVVEPDSLNKLSKILFNSNYTAVVPQIRYYNPSDVIWCCGGELNGFYESYHYKNSKVAEVLEKGIMGITFATGCALLFKRSEVGQLSEKFFFGEEDFELGLRLKNKGLKMACVLNSVIFHKESVSIDRSTRFLNKIYVHKLNRMINIKFYAPFRWPFIIFYRSFKFFLLMLIVEKIGLKKALKFGSKIFIQAVMLNSVTRETFFEILNLDLS